MGSSVKTSSVAQDNRVVVQDQGIALSTGGGSGNALKIEMLDGGSISRSFNFAENALSKMLSSIIDGQKIQQQAADTFSSAMQQSAQTQAIAAAASQAAAAEAQKTSSSWIDANKKMLLLVGLGVGGWLWWKGRK